MINVGLADDDALVRRTLTDLLATTEDVRVAWTASDGQEALELLREGGQTPVQVLLLDVQMPRLDGIALAEILQEEFPEIGVLVLTTFVADGVLDRALAAGVRGFIAKEDSVSALANTIRNVASGNMVLSPASSAIIGRRSVPGGAVAQPVVPPAPATGNTLSPRESEVLFLMTEALSNKQIAARLGVSEATVKTHVSTLIGKLGVQDRVGAVVYALRNGLV
ncbi:MAG: response regulator transcription factor [Actinomyces sp.]|uniref:response regulator transcription factor n=1 Tax=Actinomyces sp. TaxID=29317 RepID=UPI0026DDAFC6|nr:response regulator transcription factor [Actinomyces sp.]MDO4242725.1 response regulator transcription factor [Actinomyces sp.]